MLDPNLDARYGSKSIASGFTPDPTSFSVVSGGPLDASSVGAGCNGFAEPNPDYEVTYTSGTASLLRFYFVADATGDDATLIINSASGDWVCGDDSYGTKNPSVDFSPPQGGTYDIWIGSYSAGTFIPGKLYVTEVDGNHP